MPSSSRKKQRSTKVTKPSGGSAPRRQVKRFLSEEARQSLSPTSLQKRSQIMQAALETFIDYGYEGASMNLVAERAGVIKQTIYSHFQDKEDLFKTVIKSLTVDYVKGVLDDSQMHEQPLDVVLGLIAQTVFARHQDPQYARFFRTMIGEAGRFPELARLYTEATVRPGLTMVTQLIANSKDSYDIPDPEAMARVFMGAVVNHCIQQNVLLGRELIPFNFDRLLAELMRLVDLHRRPIPPSVVAGS